MMLWGGEEGPCAIVCLNGVGQFEGNEDQNYSKVLIDHMRKHLDIVANRMCIRYKNS